MEYRPQIIASDLDGLQVISACSMGAKVRVADIKYLLSNKVFLLSVERTKVETSQENKRINSILRFNDVIKVKAKNIDQKNKELIIELMAIDYLKNNNDYEINLMFKNNAHITLVVEALEILLEDQNEIKN
jgi:CRISPR/Cas system-associated exonuclease Cas4 (RecB family)